MDHLQGLKENVIIGKLIPAGSGLAQYRKEDVIDDEGNLVSDQSGAIVADALEEPTQMENEEDPVLRGWLYRAGNSRWKPERGRAGLK